jgi:hypothetical protein
MVNCYDSYTFPGSSGLSAQGVVSIMTKGVLTGKKYILQMGRPANLRLAIMMMKEELSKA